jgi:hypothetical protein
VFYQLTAAAARDPKLADQFQVKNTFCSLIIDMCTEGNKLHQLMMVLSGGLTSATNRAVAAKLAIKFVQFPPPTIPPPFLCPSMSLWKMQTLPQDGSTVLTTADMLKGGANHRYLRGTGRLPVPLPGFYLGRHVLSTAPPFILW